MAVIFQKKNGRENIAYKLCPIFPILRSFICKSIVNIKRSAAIMCAIYGFACTKMIKRYLHHGPTAENISKKKKEINIFMFDNNKRASSGQLTSS